jgi:dethiobiotin synthetase
VRIELGVIADAYVRLAARADVVVVEGAGGFRVPLNDCEDTADLAAALGLPIVLVVGLRLGCINHALLSTESIHARGLGWAGWVGNHIDPAMEAQAENIAALRQRLPQPCIGIQPWSPATPATVPSWLDAEPLLALLNK